MPIEYMNVNYKFCKNTSVILRAQCIIKKKKNHEHLLKIFLIKENVRMSVVI